jgi:hypothetical protein
VDAQSGNEWDLSVEVRARIETVEANLSELDPILTRFCAENGYTLSRIVGVRPRRRLWIREEIDRSFDLTTDLSVSELMERGFFQTMPWSLYATASQMLRPDEPARFLSKEVMRGLPFSHLAAMLPDKLREGLSILRQITAEQVIAKGQIHGPAISGE